MLVLYSYLFVVVLLFYVFFFFFFNDTATTEIYTLSLHDALPISASRRGRAPAPTCPANAAIATLTRSSSPSTSTRWPPSAPADRKSTRLNSSHSQISYAVFCLKKKKKKNIRDV